MHFCTAYVREQIQPPLACRRVEPRSAVCLCGILSSCSVQIGQSFGNQRPGEIFMIVSHYYENFVIFKVLTFQCIDSWNVHIDGFQLLEDNDYFIFLCSVVTSAQRPIVQTVFCEQAQGATLTQNVLMKTFCSLLGLSICIGSQEFPTLKQQFIFFPTKKKSKTDKQTIKNNARALWCVA